MSSTTTHNRRGAQQRSEAVRMWNRLDAATGSLAILDPDLPDEAPLVGQIRALGVDLTVHRDPLHALVRCGADAPDVVVLSAAMVVPDLAQYVEVIRCELTARVLLAFQAGELEAIGPAIAAGAMPAIARPYRFEEMTKALAPHWPRRTPQRERVTIGDLVINIDGYDAHLGNVGVDFTTVEFDVLTVLARTPDHVVLREPLAARLWPTSPDPDGALVATITRIRRKLARVGAPDAIHTVRGLGYRLEAAGLRATAPRKPS